MRANSMRNNNQILMTKLDMCKFLRGRPRMLTLRSICDS